MRNLISHAGTAPLLILAGLALACEQSQPTSPTGDAPSGLSLSRAIGPHLVAYKGEYTVQIVSVDLAGRCAGTSAPLTFNEVGSGHATHLGRFQVVQSFCQASPTALEFTGGLAIFTAANGDQLFDAFEGHVLAPTAPNIFPFEGTFTFTGGTGRFGGATGSGTFTGEFDGSSGRSHIVKDGVISSLGSSK